MWSPADYRFRAWQMVPSDVIALSPRGEIVDCSSRLAASGTPLHLSIYETFHQVGAVVHCHAPYSLAFASLGVPVPSVTNQADTLGRIPCLITNDAAIKEQVQHTSCPARTRSTDTAWRSPSTGTARLRWPAASMSLRTVTHHPRRSRSIADRRYRPDTARRAGVRRGMAMGTTGRDHRSRRVTAQHMPARDPRRTWHRPRDRSAGRHRLGATATTENRRQHPSSACPPYGAPGGRRADRQPGAPSPGGRFFSHRR